MKNKKSFLLYTDQKEVVDSLTDNQAGKLYKAVYAHAVGENYPLNAFLSSVFIPIRQSLDRAKENYERVSRINSQNAKKRWNQPQKDAKLYDRIRSNANAYDSDSDSDSDITHKKKEKDNPMYLTQHEIWDIAYKNGCDITDVINTYKAVINPDNRNKYKIKSSKLTLNKWVGRAISKNEIQASQDENTLALLKLNEPKPEKANLLVTNDT